MRLRGLIEEDFVNYKSPSFFIGTCFCDFKCCTEAGIPISTCQNRETEMNEIRDISDLTLVIRYKENPMSHAIVFGGLEPFLQFEEMLSLIVRFRTLGVLDPIIIYTGYEKDELMDKLPYLSSLKNIIVKFGRYKPGLKSRYDPVLGVTLASENQYAEELSVYDYMKGE